MNFRFHPDAEQELLAAVAYYEEREPGLGLDFAREIYDAIQNARAYPMVWPEIAEQVRRSLVRRFPYGVLYSVEEDGILIIAVMHLRSAPDYWKQRAPK
jgi:plasmid stabilization system protein ParE